MSKRKQGSFLDSMTMEYSTHASFSQGEGEQHHVGEREFARVVLKHVTSGICRHVGYGSAGEHAIETLTDVLEQYLGEVAQACHAFAEQSGRTQGNATDVLMALEDAGIDVHEVYQYADQNQQEIFEIPLPLYPQHPRPHDDPFSIVLHDVPRKKRPSHIPAHFPPLPPNHTYIHTPVFSEMVRDPCVHKMRKVKERTQAADGVTSFMVRTHLAPARTLDGNRQVMTWPPKPSYLDPIRGQNGVRIDVAQGVTPGAAPTNAIGGEDENAALDDDLGLDDGDDDLPIERPADAVIGTGEEDVPGASGAGGDDMEQ